MLPSLSSTRILKSDIGRAVGKNRAKIFGPLTWIIRFSGSCLGAQPFQAVVGTAGTRSYAKSLRFTTKMLSPEKRMGLVLQWSRKRGLSR